MAKIARKDQKIFCSSNSSDIGQFGSGAAGTKVTSDDLDTLQNLAAFLNGWSSATISAQKLPPLEEFNCLSYILTYQAAYLFQEGIAEYSAGTEYHQNSIVKKSGTTALYKSSVNDNIAISLSAAAYSYATTYAEDDVVTDPITNDIYISLQNSNTGNALSNSSFWTRQWRYLGDLTEILDERRRDNLILNPYGQVHQQGDSFTGATTPANNDDTYTFDEWITISDGNDIADESLETSFIPDGTPSMYKYIVATADKRFGKVQILRNVRSLPAINKKVSLSLQASLGGTNATLDTIRVAVLSWTGTADSVTSDPVSNWQSEGTNPTLAANWVYEKVSDPILLSASSYINIDLSDINIDESGAKNIALIWWVENDDATVADELYIGGFNLVVGTRSLPIEYYDFLEDEDKCLKSFERVGGTSNEAVGIGTIQSTTTASANFRYKKKKWSNSPVISFSAVSAISVQSNAVAQNTSALSAASITDEGFIIQATFSSIGSLVNNTCLRYQISGSNYFDIDSRL